MNRRSGLRVIALDVYLMYIGMRKGRIEFHVMNIFGADGLNHL